MKKAVDHISFLFLVVSLLLPNLVLGQVVDSESKAIMDKLSTYMNGLNSARINFTVTQDNLQNSSSNKDKGTIILKGNSYKVSTGSMDIYGNGSALWTYLKSSNEVSIVPAGASKNSLDFTNPRSILNIYNKDFKYNYVGEETINNKVFYKIDLYPVNLKSSTSRIRIAIDKNKNQLSLAKVFYSDGTHFTFEITSFIANPMVNDQEITFNPANYPGIEVIDMR